MNPEPDDGVVAPTVTCGLPASVLADLRSFCATRPPSPTTVHPAWRGLRAKVELAGDQEQRDEPGVHQPEVELSLTAVELALLLRLRGALPSLEQLRVRS
ncbi:hypothetical protein M8C13_32740 [Crossiella sp. SN42]|uniref:hypothetical protein n=1 Tax=Crossiella sp. SN42 TaxID=2944808 RepID=UPI00207CD71A|nr:hypothetical protein [Crossiella sp. SN42]MCO1580533.1 hypothetical protein [Crossiella sp. SN42]